MTNKNWIKEAWEDPFKNLFFFLAFGTFALSLATDALSELVFESLADWTEQELGILPEIFRFVIFIVFLSIVILVVNWHNIEKWFASQSVPTGVQPIALVGTFPGLITVMSKVPPGATSPAEAAIEHHWQNGNGNLQHCWLICGGRQSLESALILLKKYTGQDFDENLREFTLSHSDNPSRELKLSLREIPITDMNNPYASLDDPNATFKLVNQIYEEAAAEEIEPENIIADYTGGTKSMTAGLILACTSSERRLQYMRPVEYDDKGYADRNFPSKATEVKIAFKLKAMRD